MTLKRGLILIIIFLIFAGISCSQTNAKRGMASRPSMMETPRDEKQKGYTSDQSATTLGDESSEKKSEEMESREMATGQAPSAPPEGTLPDKDVNFKKPAEPPMFATEREGLKDFQIRSKKLEPEIESFELDKNAKPAQYWEDAISLKMANEAPMAAGGAEQKGESNDIKKDRGVKAKEEKPAPSLPEFRIRSRFPEILFFDPNVETDNLGEAIIKSSVGDAISSYDVEVSAASKKGEWGRGQTSFRTFMPFFIDFDPPRKLHVGDTVDLSAAIFNYTEKSLDVSVQIKSGSGINIVNNVPRRFKVNPRKAVELSFTSMAKDYGRCDLSITAQSGSQSDSIKRTIEILPAESEIKYQVGGILKNGMNDIEISIPQNAIVPAYRSDFQVRIYGDLSLGAIDIMRDLDAEPHSSLVRSIAYLDSALLTREKFSELSSISKSNDEIERAIDKGWGRILAFRNGDGFALYPGETPDPIANILVFETMGKLGSARVIDENLRKSLETQILQFALDKKSKLVDRLYAASLILDQKNVSIVTKSKLQSLFNLRLVSESGDPAVQALVLYCGKVLNRPGAGILIPEKLQRNLDRMDFSNSKTDSDILAWRGSGFAPVFAFALKGGFGQSIKGNATLKDELASLLVNEFNDPSSTSIEKVDALFALNMMNVNIPSGEMLKSIAVNGKKLDTKSIGAKDGLGGSSGTLEIPFNVKPGSNRIAITTSTPGLHYQVVGRYYSKSEKQAEIPNVSFVLPGKIDPNGMFHAELAITTPRQFSGRGTIIKLALPPGVKPLDNPRALASRVSADYAEIHDSEIILYFKNLESGTSKKFIIPMISDLKGDFYIDPPSVESDSTGIAFPSGKSSRVKWI